MDLARRPWWLAGTAASVVASLLQMVALANGPVLAVQCVLMAGLPAAAVVESALRRRWPGRRLAAGIVAGTAGPLALLLLLAPSRPTVLRAVPVDGAVLVVVLVVLVVGAGLLVAARRPGPAGAPGLGLACGAGYGLTAALLAIVVRRGLDDPASLVAAPALYGVLLVGPASFLLSQSALQRARHSAPVLVPILLADPLVALVTGVVWFDEPVRLGVGVVLGALLALAVTVLGVRLTGDGVVRPGRERGRGVGGRGLIDPRPDGPRAPG